jgi:hypothetical protein
VNIIPLRKGITFFRGIAIPEGIDNLFKKKIKKKKKIIFLFNFLKLNLKKKYKKQRN